MEKKEFKSFFKNVGGNEGSKCRYPGRLDTYGCGCSHDCKYCYAKSLLNFRKLWNPEDPSVADLSKVKKQINFTRGKPNEKSIIPEPEDFGGAEEGRPHHHDGRAAALRLLPLEREDSRPAHGREQDFLAHGRAQRQARRRILHGSDAKADVKRRFRRGCRCSMGMAFRFIWPTSPMCSRVRLPEAP